MKFFRNLVITAVVSLIFGAIGGYIFFGAYQSYYHANNIGNNNSTITKVEYPKIESSNYEKVIEKAFDTVVEIRTTVVTNSFFGQSEGQKLGSGVIISQDGYIVTNNHVIDGATNLKIVTSDGLNYDAAIIGADDKSDVAIIKINANNLTYASIADSDQLKLGQETVVIGNPLGEGISCSNGIVSALAKEIEIDNNPMTLIQTNAAVNEGNSGGGLFNMNGDLIGIVNAKSSSTYYGETSIEGVGYAIPSNTVSKILEDLLTYGYVKQRATLGISVYNSAYVYNGRIGLLVESVVEGSAAEEAGIKNGDLLIEIDGESITSYAQLTKILLNHEIGDQVKIKAIRNDKEYTFKVKLKEATKRQD